MLSPERRSEVHTIAQMKSPVKTKNIKLASYKQDDDLTLKKCSKIGTHCVHVASLFSLSNTTGVHIVINIHHKYSL